MQEAYAVVLGRLLSSRGLLFSRGMRVRDFFSRPDCYTTALAADIFMRGRWTDSERTAMFGHVARQSASIYDDSRAGRLISLHAAKMDTPVS